MNKTTVYTRSRSAFYLRVNENEDGSFNFFVSEDLKPVFSYHFKMVEDASPTGWKSAKSNTKYIWVPKDKADKIDVNEVKNWAEYAGNQCVWLSPSKHIAPYFDRNLIDYCISADFNFTTNETGSIEDRSSLGEAEWQLKYHLGDLTDVEKEEYINTISEALFNMISLLPIRTNDRQGKNDYAQQPLVSPIPAQKDSSKLAWVFAEYVAKQKDFKFLEPILLAQKPKMKELPILSKIETWSKIYNTPYAVDIDLDEIKDRTIIVIDDLYQSGVTIWAYAKFLKAIGARRVYGLACVKSMKDTDNQ